MQQLVHVGAEALLAFVGDVDLRKCLTSQIKVIVYLSLTELTDTYLVIETGDLSHFHIAVECLGIDPALELSTLFVVGTVEGIDKHVGLLVRRDVATNGLAKHRWVAIDVEQVVL